MRFECQHCDAEVSYSSKIFEKTTIIYCNYCGHKHIVTLELMESKK